MGEFNIIPILGRKKDVPPNALSMFQYKKDGSIYTHDAGGVNFDLSRGPGLCDKSYGYNKLSLASINAVWQNVQDYTEVDPNGKIETPEKYKVTYSALNPDDDNHYCYYDFGPDFFKGDWEFRFDQLVDSGFNRLAVVPWSLSNDLDGFYTNSLASSARFTIGVWLGQSSAGDYFTHILEETLGGSALQVYESSASSAHPAGERRYYHIYRDSSEGAYGHIHCYAYSDADETDEVWHGDIEEDNRIIGEVSPGSGFRYLHALSNYDKGADFGYYWSGDVQNLRYYSRVEF